MSKEAKSSIEKPKRGRPEYGPSGEQRAVVCALAAYGVPQEEIARHLGVAPKTLRNHFRDELDKAAIDANAKVAASLFELATTGGNVTAAIFWLKTRAGWSETASEHRHRHTHRPEGISATEAWVEELFDGVGKKKLLPN